MLTALVIRDVVLIEELALDFKTGLSVLTGETGAGKSILLDSLGLALGQRAEARLVRGGAKQASVTAIFDVAANHPARALLDDAEIASEGDLILRRTLAADGRSRAFINDQATSIGLLSQVGDCLVEIQGQFDQHGLLNPKNHLSLLDAFAGHTAAVGALANRYQQWRDAEAAHAAAIADLERARSEEDYLRHTVNELDQLAPVRGEENQLAEKRALLMNADDMLRAMQDATAAIGPDSAGETAITTALKALERAAPKSGGQLDAAIAGLDRALSELTEAQNQLDDVGTSIDADGSQLEATEERLFALRDLARKHRVEVDDLPRIHQELAHSLAQLDQGADTISSCRAAADAAQKAYATEAAAISAARQAAAKKLDQAVAVELPPLKMERAGFATSVLPLPVERWGADGSDAVTFEVATNPGSAPGPLNKIASGGELSRFLLALKVVLASAHPVPTLVFDEVDAGVGGAVAAAVGERLALLGQDVQILVVTHSPQVAARGAHHLRVAKAINAGNMVTDVARLSAPERREEVARMLAGSNVTDAARAAADQLLENDPEAR